MNRTKTLLIAAIFPALTVQAAHAADPPTGLWRGWLDCPGGEIPFHFELSHEGDKWSGWLINEPDRSPIPKVTWDGKELVLDISHYDSVLRVKPAENGDQSDQWNGSWRKRSKVDKWVEMHFHAKPGPHARFPSFCQGFDLRDEPDIKQRKKDLPGNWWVKFAQETEPSVAVFGRAKPSEAGLCDIPDMAPSGITVSGTLMSTTGDSGFLTGMFDGNELMLSNFDGAHAFLFTAKSQPDGTLAGNFWSRDAFHDTWTAKKDPNAQLPDAFEMTKGVDNADLAKVAFPDLNGKTRSLADPEFAGKARVIEVFGSWCPNCHDASHYLADLHRRFRDRGLSVLGLAFELTGDLPRDTQQVKTFVERHKVEYPVLVAGVSDREKASASLPMLDKLRAFPTLIVLDRQGKVRAVYTGFSGPATGEAYTAFQTKFESLIEHMLAEGQAAKP